MNWMEETLEAIVSALNSLGVKEVIGTGTGTVTGVVIGTETAVTDMIREETVILTQNVSIAMDMVTGPEIAQKNEIEANATTAGNLDTNLEIVPNVRSEEEVTVEVEVPPELLAEEVLLLEEHLLLHEEARALHLKETTTTAAAATTTTTTKVQVHIVEVTAEVAVVVVPLIQRLLARALTIAAQAPGTTELPKTNVDILFFFDGLHSWLPSEILNLSRVL